jgi:NAD(P)-dependent dehydrogenase (short-subunit alcohol dehydrogenase family)
MVDRRIAVVTGGNRGLGFETCRQLARRGYVVIVGSRDPARGQHAVDELRVHGSDAELHALDVTQPSSIEALGRTARERWRRVDVLVNCAGVPGGPHEMSVLDMEDEQLLRVLEVNFFGALHMCQELVPLMRRANYGRVVNVSSGMGQLAEMGKGSPPYRFSKVALNVLTRILSQELLGTNVLVNSVCPGWVRTDMGGPRATLSVEEGARGIVWAATLDEGGPSGGFFRHGERIAW